MSQVAEPQADWGSASAITSITNCEACRVAIFGRSLPNRDRICAIYVGNPQGSFDSARHGTATALSN